MKIKGHKNVFHCYYFPFIKTRFSMSYISIYVHVSFHVDLIAKGKAQHQK